MKRDRRRAFGRVSDGALSSMSENLSSLLDAGMTLPEAVGAAADSAADKKAASLLKRAAHDISEGYSLSESIASSRSTPSAFAAAIGAGEAAGRLSECLAAVGGYYGMRSGAIARIRAALRYPCFILALAVVVVAIVINGPMRVILSMLENADAELPAYTWALMAICRFLSSWRFAVLIAATAAAVAAATALVKHTRLGAAVYRRAVRGIPAVGGILRLLDAAAFSGLCSMMMSSCMAAHDAVRIAGRALGIDALSDAADKIEAGYGIAESLRRARCLPVSVIYDVATAERAHTLNTTLQTMSLHYIRQAGRRIDAVISMSEPVLTVAVGIVVAFIVISIYVPLFSVYGTI